MSAARSPLRSLSALLLAAFIAVSLIATAADALAATPRGAGRGWNEPPAGELHDFLRGGPFRGVTWE
jgi:hypothetical protein